MESSHFSQKHIDLNLLCLRIVKSKFFLYVYYMFAKHNPNWIEENCCGKVDSDLLSYVISMSEYDYKCLLILEQVIEFVNDSSITDEIFNKLFHFPLKTAREGFLISLSHKRLSEKQLLLLCYEECAFECYFELAILYYTDSKYSFEIFSKFILKFSISKYGELLEDMLRELINSYIPSDEKKHVFCKQMFKTETQGNGSSVFKEPNN